MITNLRMWVLSAQEPHTVTGNIKYAEHTCQYLNRTIHICTICALWAVWASFLVSVQFSVKPFCLVLWRLQVSAKANIQNEHVISQIFMSRDLLILLIKNTSWMFLSHLRHSGDPLTPSGRSGGERPLLILTWQSTPLWAPCWLKEIINTKMQNCCHWKQTWKYSNEYETYRFHRNVTAPSPGGLWFW